MKSILITGASSGIGFATAIEAAKQGWRVFACGRNEANLHKLSQESELIETLVFDLTDLEACKSALSELAIDVALLNAGTCEYVDIEHWDSNLFKRVFDANFFSVIHCIEALLPSLSKGNQIVFVDSLARLLPFTQSQAYGASKAALHYLAKTMEVDLKDKGVVVQTVSPGFVKTALTDKNTFEMPMRISAEAAAISIMKAVNKKIRSAYFPFIFSSLIRAMSGLPSGLQAAICSRLKHDSGVEV